MKLFLLCVLLVMWALPVAAQPSCCVCNGNAQCFNTTWPPPVHSLDLNDCIAGCTFMGGVQVFHDPGYCSGGIGVGPCVAGTQATATPNMATGVPTSTRTFTATGGTPTLTHTPTRTFTPTGLTATPTRTPTITGTRPATATKTPTPTPTLTFTPVSLGTPLPTFTSPPGETCQDFVQQVGDAVDTLAWGCASPSQVLDPAQAACYSPMNNANFSTWHFAQTCDQGLYYVETQLSRWNTAALPDDAVFTTGAIRLLPNFVRQLSSTTNFNIEWFDWSAGCDPNTFHFPVYPEVVSGVLSGFAEGVSKTLPLLDFREINRTGYTYVRGGFDSFYAPLFYDWSLGYEGALLTPPVLHLCYTTGGPTATPYTARTATPSWTPTPSATGTATTHATRTITPTNTAGVPPTCGTRVTIVNTLTDHDDGCCDAADCTLREAVTYSVASETITFSVTGTITLRSGQIDIAHALTVTGPGVANLTIDADHWSRVFEVTATSAVVRMSGITFTNGYVDPAGFVNWNKAGGSLRISGDGAWVTVTDSTFTGNRAAQGGAIWIGGEESGLTVVSSIFTGNSAQELGGAISCGGTTVIPTGQGRMVPALECSIIQSAFDGNWSDGDAGVVYSTQLLFVNQSSFTNNSVTNNGFFGNGSVFHHHSSWLGTIANSTFCLNNGSVAYSSCAPSRLNNVTFTRNTSPFETDLGDRGTLSNVIIGESTNPDTFWPLCGGPATGITPKVSEGNNIDAGNSCLLTGPGDQINTASNLAACGTDIGTPNVVTACPNPGSAAIEGGNASTPGTALPACENVDERGIVRPQMVTCDVGACEVFSGIVPSPTVPPAPTPTPIGPVGCCHCPEEPSTLACFTQFTENQCGSPCTWTAGAVCVLVF